MRKLLLIVALGCMVSGCVVGNTHRYDLGNASFDLDSDKTVAATTVDIRPAVRSGDKTPDFVGFMRGGFGNPWEVTTDSGRPLADDVTLSVVESLKADNVRALAVTNPPNTGVAEARKALLAANADRFALLLMKAWKSDTFMNTGLTYDLSLSVLQQDGTVIATTEVKGHDNLGTALVPADARKNTEKAFRAKLEDAFNHPDIRSALR